MDNVDTAKQIFERAKYQAAEEDIKKLADNIALLENRGLGKLNKRLIESVRKPWNTIVEHNFVVMLVSHHAATIPINYEPSYIVPPPDFKVEMEDITYWIQMKDLSKLKRENIQDKIIQQIKMEASKSPVGKFFSCMLSDDFKEDCLSELTSFIKEKAASATEGEGFFFTSKNNQKAKIEFWSAEKIALSELTLGYAGDLETVEITGLAKEQIKESLLNAGRAFNWAVDRREVNLIAM